jgi:hypothetical protein
MKKEKGFLGMREIIAWMWESETASESQGRKGRPGWSYWGGTEVGMGKDGETLTFGVDSHEGWWFSDGYLFAAPIATVTPTCHSTPRTGYPHRP